MVRYPGHCHRVLALNYAGQNKVLIVSLEGLKPLISQMNSANVEVQCNAVGCITNLATHEDNKARIAKSGALPPLTRLAKSKDMRVQRNATGALLNMTHSDDNRQQLVLAGAIPVLVSLLSSQDTDVQYYCTTALSNIAVDSANRKRLAQTEPKLVQSLVTLMKGQAPKVQCQAALALRNLASDEKYQLDIVRADGLKPLLQLLQSSYLPLILSAVACIRNISIHPMNESPIIDAGFLRPLVDLLGSTDNEEIQCHAISTLRNLAASSDKNKQLVLEAGAVQKCKELVLNVPLSVQSEMTAAIAVLALSDDLKTNLLGLGVFDVLIPLTESESIEVQGNSAAALGNLSSKGMYYKTCHRDLADSQQLAITPCSSPPGINRREVYTVTLPASWHLETRPSSTLRSGLCYSCSRAVTVSFLILSTAAKTLSKWSATYRRRTSSLAMKVKAAKTAKARSYSLRVAASRSLAERPTAAERVTAKVTRRASRPRSLSSDGRARFLSSPTICTGLCNLVLLAASTAFTRRLMECHPTTKTTSLDD
jgi:HEAT repeat protein